MVSAIPKERIADVLVFIEFRNKRAVPGFDIEEPCDKTKVLEAAKRTGKIVMAELVKSLGDNAFRFRVPPPRKWHYPGKLHPSDSHVIQLYLVLDGKVSIMNTSTAFHVVPIWKSDEKSIKSDSCNPPVVHVEPINKCNLSPNIKEEQEQEQEEREKQKQKQRDVKCLRLTDDETTKAPQTEEEEEETAPFKCNLPPTVLNVLANQPHQRFPSSNDRSAVLPEGFTVFGNPNLHHPQNASCQESRPLTMNIRSTERPVSSTMPSLAHLPRLDLLPTTTRPVHSFQEQYFSSGSIAPPSLAFSRLVPSDRISGRRSSSQLPSFPPPPRPHAYF